jgi:hypothetical protein
MLARRLPGLLILTILAFMLLLLVAQPVEAARHPHFTAHGTFAVVNGDGLLAVSFQEVGLGHVATPVLYRVEAMPLMSVPCLNAAGRPFATAFLFSGPVVAFASGTHNGQNALTVVLPAPSPGTFFCPFATSLALVQYSPAVVTDLTNGVSYTIPGPFSLPVQPGLPPIFPALD